MVDFNKLRELRPKNPPDLKGYMGLGRKARAIRRHELEVLAEIEAKKVLKPGRRFNRIIAPQSKRFQHNVQPD